MTVLPPSVAWTGESIRVIDQRALPDELLLLDLREVDDVVDAIASLAIRGANVIGSAGALGVALGISQGLDPRATAERIAAARPTAVNLRHAIETVMDAAASGSAPLGAALALIESDAEQCRLIGEFGRIELADASTILTHCNTGKLATTGWGTGLGIIYAKQQAGERVRVLATETRPLRQGARLTAWELAASGIEVEVVVDSAAAAALSERKVDAVIVGADRIAANGDTANKIGTRSLAIAARYEGVPFYVAATLNAIDPSTADGSGIPIELRSAHEVLEAGMADGVEVWNPAFDVTPAELITGIVTEVGVLLPPFEPAIRRALAS
jgi:methylthioribose-1-phosphate isomerase